MALHRYRRDELENSLNKGALWAVTYGDLMSFLMIFFLLLYTFSIAKADKTKSRKYEESLQEIQKAFGGKIDKEKLQKARIKEEEEKMAKRLQKKMGEKKQASFVEMETDEKKIRLMLSESILFDSGKSKLKLSAKKVLSDIIGEFKDMPNEILIEGHTDNLPMKNGKYRSNWELSTGRAYSVIMYMKKMGIQPDRMACIGYGEYRPITKNRTPKERAKNRRIEISFVKTE